MFCRNASSRFVGVAVTRAAHAQGAVTLRYGAQAERLVLLPARDWKQQQGLLEADF